MFIDEILDNAARDRPHDTALIYGTSQWTFAELDHRVTHMAAALQGLAAAGDRIAVLAENHPAVVEAYYAVPRAGMSLVLLNYRLAPRELAAMLADSGARVLIAERRLLDALAPLASQFPDLERRVVLDGARGGESDYATLLEGEARLAPVGGGAAADLAWLIYTSGTTGRPKGVILSHANLLAGIQATLLGRPIAAEAVYLYPFPLCHVSGFNVYAHHLMRRPVVLMRRFSPPALCDEIATHRVSAMSLAPTMIAALLEDACVASADLSTLRSIGYGASSIPTAVLRRGLEVLGCDFAQGYGMTELAGNAVFLDAEAHRRGLAGEEHLLLAAGRPGPLVGLRIADDGGGDVGSGEVGEIVVRGAQVSSGYWRDPEATAASRLGAWFRTGDMGRFDAEGFLYVVDRKKDIIVSGGENIASREVEDVLHAHPAVLDAAVVGEADRRWGENVCAFVVKRRDASVDTEQLIDFVRQRLASYKKPKRVVFVDELPRTASGKVAKAALRSRLR